MQLSLSSHLLVYGQCRPSDLVAAHAAGVTQLELWLAEPHVEWRNLEACRRFRAQLGDSGLTTGSVHLPFYPSVPELLNEGKKWSLIDPNSAARRQALQGARDGLAAAHELGAQQAVLHLGWQRDAWGAKEAGWAREAVGQLLADLPADGPGLCLENIISSGTRAQALIDLLDEIDPEQRAGICLDLGHAHVDGGVLDELRVALPRLRHLHLHDNDGCSDDHLAPGCGTIPWSAVMDALRAAQYTGLGALEVRDFSRGERPAAEVVSETLQQSAKVFSDLNLPPAPPQDAPQA